jgi:hypothetical protein
MIEVRRAEKRNKKLEVQKNKTRKKVEPTIRVGHMNPDGLLTPGKILACQKLAETQNLDVLALTETQLSEYNLDIADEATGKL